MPKSPATLSRTLAVRAALAAILVLGGGGGALRAQADEDCLSCHEEKGLTGERHGREISVSVDPKLLDTSVHADLDCVMCHQDLAGIELPHEADVAKVDCGACHDRVAEEQHRSLHGRAEARGDPLAPTCTRCHGTHHILPHASPEAPTSVMKIPELCGQCHHEGTPVSLERNIPQDRILENYSESIHGEGLYRKGLTVTAVCTSCHNAHEILPHTDPASSIHPANVAATCTRCHARIEDVHRRFIEGHLWKEQPETIPACIDCHSPHKIRRAFYPAGMANQDCLRCHADPRLQMTREGRTISLFVDETAYASGEHQGTPCAQCHTEVKSSKERPCETIQSKVNCGICHAEQVENYQTGIHGQLSSKDDPDAPRCLDCHDRHATTSKNDPRSRTFPRNVPNLCAQCHRQGEKAAVRIDSEVPDIVGSFNESIHGKGLIQSGLVVTATCADCHTPHTELPPDDPASSVNEAHIADTCGSCHHGIEETFKTSVHWPENTDTDKELPTCEDCHSSHTISRIDQAGFRMKMMDQCGRCHEGESTTFFDTFHGKVSRLGSEGAAKCYDCHGTHDIMRVDDPESTLSRDNVVETCGKCHEGSHRRFAGYLTHATHHDADKYPYLYWSFWFMTVLLVGTLSFALLHTFAWLIRLWLTKAQWKGHKDAPQTGKLYRRFNRYQRTMHIVMMICFFTLALSGMALKFSYMRWAEIVSVLMGGFETMGILHRIAAVGLASVFVAHFITLRRQKKDEGISWWKLATGPDSILFNLNDVKEIFQSIRWFFGLGERPHYGRYTYWEKFDYFAVLWGIMIIGSTGLLLWFPELFTRALPGWSVNVATIIHSDEALLAVGFIFTIHFFNTHFRPDKFPMDKGMFTGRVPIEELMYDKPREYEALVASGRLEEHLVDPLPKGVERGFKVFGFTALAIGLTLIALIVYSMLFGYR